MKLKKLDINKAEKFVTKTIVLLEGVNRLQAEKSAVVESYFGLKQEYLSGKISFEVYSLAVDKLNAEIEKLDSMIEHEIKSSELSYEAITKYLKLQRPVRIKFTAEKI